MTSKHLVDPELIELLEIWPETPFTLENLPALRALRVEIPPVESAGAEITVTTHMAPGPVGAPDVAVTTFTPPTTRGTPLPGIFHIHGGGYVVGTADEMEPHLRPLAAALNCFIATVDYRLAPETPFPGPVEDCYAGLAWVLAHAQELGIDARRVGVMGESAGGGLAAALALLVRDRGALQLSFQHLVYPMLDDRTCSAPDPHPYTGEFVWTAASNTFGWSSLLGCPPGSQGISPYAVPARATDLSRLPPTFIATAALDLFVEENLEYARRLMRHGVPVELHVYPGAYHGFDFDPKAEVAIQARRDRLEGLKRALRPKTTG